MKTIIAMCLALCVGFGASAQRHIAVGGYHYHPRVLVSVGAYAPFYPYYGYGFGYPWFNYGYVAPRPSRLDLQIEDIRNDYRDKIWSAKHDDRLTKKERREEVHALKHERDEAISDAKHDYWKKK